MRAWQSYSFKVQENFFACLHFFKSEISHLKFRSFDWAVCILSNILFCGRTKKILHLLQKFPRYKQGISVEHILSRNELRSGFEPQTLR